MAAVDVARRSPDLRISQLHDDQLPLSAEHRRLRDTMNASPPRPVEALIVGAGPTGLVLAVWFG